MKKQSPKDQTYESFELTHCFPPHFAVLEFGNRDFRSRNFLEMLEQELQDACMNFEVQHLLLDFNGVRLVPSSAVALLLNWSQEARENGVELHVYNVDPDVGKAFELLNVGKFVALHKSKKEAIAAAYKDGDSRRVDASLMSIASLPGQMTRRAKLTFAAGLVLCLIGGALLLHHLFSSLPPDTTPVMDVICTETGWEGKIRIEGDWRICPETGRPTLKLAAACPKCKAVAPMLNDELFLDNSMEAVLYRVEEVLPICEDCAADPRWGKLPDNAGPKRLGIRMMPKGYVFREVVKVAPQDR
jgi:anti-anti-sigma factor